MGCGVYVGTHGNTWAVQARIKLAVSTAPARTLSQSFARMARTGRDSARAATDSAHRSRIVESCDITSRFVAAVPLVAAQVTAGAFSASLHGGSNTSGV